MASIFRDSNGDPQEVAINPSTTIWWCVYQTGDVDITTQPVLYLWAPVNCYGPQDDPNAIILEPGGTNDDMQYTWTDMTLLARANPQDPLFDQVLFTKAIPNSSPDATISFMIYYQQL